MVVVGFISWWYGLGLQQRMISVWRHITETYEYFSIGQLLRTWFSPFRQISAGAVSGSMSVQWHAFTDRTISRFVGGFMRTVMIITGAVSIILMVLFGCIAILVWILIPVVPLLGVLLSLLGWMPW